MVRVKLRAFAQARSGDKGDTVNIALFAPTDALYATLLRVVTPERVKKHFAGVVEGGVRRYELPNIRALNFVCEQALNGGGSASIRLDNLGKCFGANLLRMEIDVEEQALAEAGVHAPRRVENQPRRAQRARRGDAENEPQRAQRAQRGE